MPYPVKLPFWSDSCFLSFLVFILHSLLKFNWGKNEKSLYLISSSLSSAFFDEPLLSVQPTCHSINITVTVSNGFPQPEIRWQDSSGSDINQTSWVQLDSRGRYAVSSNIDYRPNGVETITMEMKLEVLKQSFTRSLLLHPPPDPCQGQSVTML